MVSPQKTLFLLALLFAALNAEVIASDKKLLEDIQEKDNSTHILRNLTDKEWLKKKEGREFLEEILNQPTKLIPSVQDKKKTMKTFSLKKEGITFELSPFFDTFNINHWIDSSTKKFKDCINIKPNASMNEYLFSQSNENTHKFCFVLTDAPDKILDCSLLLEVNTQPTKLKKNILHRRSVSADKKEEINSSLSSKKEDAQRKKSDTQVKSKPLTPVTSTNSTTKSSSNVSSQNSPKVPSQDSKPKHLVEKYELPRKLSLKDKKKVFEKN